MTSKENVAMHPLNNLTSGAFTLEFKRELPQNAEEEEGTAINSEIGDKNGDKSVINEESNQKNEKSNQKSNQKIFELILQNHQITINELMQNANLSESGVKKVLRTLKSQNLIRRVGPDKGGHWEIVE